MTSFLLSTARAIVVARPRRGDFMLGTASPKPWLILLAFLAAASLLWGARHAIGKSDDLMRRSEEIGLFLRGEDPYRDPDMTYPPTALPVFAVLVGPFHGLTLRGAWLAGNLLALAAVARASVALWGDGWPSWLRVAVPLLIAASKPVRLTLGMGQFSLIALALMLLSVEAIRAQAQVRAGLLVGLALVKPTMAVPLVGFLLVRHAWKAVTVALGLQLALLLGVSAWLGMTPIHLLERWLEVARKESTAGLIDLPSVAARLWPGAARMAMPMVLASLALFAVVLVAGRRKGDLALVSLSTFTAALFAYHRPYDLVLLLPPLILVIDAAVASRRVPMLLAGLAFAALMIAPSHPALLPERLYDAVFIPSAYLLFGLTVHRVIRHEAEGGQPPEPGPGLASSG